MRIRTWLSCALTAALLVGCSSDAEPAPRAVQELAGPEEPSPPPSPPPPPTPPPPPDVEGDVVEVDVWDLSASGSGLFAEGTARDASVPIDDEAVDAAVGAATAWIDAHLTDLQRGGPGWVADAGLIGDAAAASRGLIGPERPVISTSYRVRVAVHGAPEWVAVAAEVQGADGTAGAWFVFLPDGGAVRLVAVHPDEGTAAPTASSSAPGTTGTEESA